MGHVVLRNRLRRLELRAGMAGDGRCEECRGVPAGLPLIIKVEIEEGQPIPPAPPLFKCANCGWSQGSGRLEPGGGPMLIRLVRVIPAKPTEATLHELEPHEALVSEPEATAQHAVEESTTPIDPGEHQPLANPCTCEGCLQRHAAMATWRRKAIGDNW